MMTFDVIIDVTSMLSYRSPRSPWPGVGKATHGRRSDVAGDDGATVAAAAADGAAEMAQKSLSFTSADE